MYKIDYDQRKECPILDAVMNLLENPTEATVKVVMDEIIDWEVESGAWEIRTERRGVTMDEGEAEIRTMVCGMRDNHSGEWAKFLYKILSHRFNWALYQEFRSLSPFADKILIVFDRHWLGYSVRSLLPSEFKALIGSDKCWPADDEKMSYILVLDKPKVSKVCRVDRKTKKTKKR